MCGIVGFYNQRLKENSPSNVLMQMLERLYHRGPDECGYYHNNQVGLGNARLSIIDLEHGQQPMSDSTSRYWLVYNGQIYNYLELMAELTNLGCQFKTTCDTEVVLQSFIFWGKDAFAKLNGAFAFALYDKLENSLYLVRDTYGERPLFYSWYQDTLIFGSEIKSIAQYPGVSLSFEIDELASCLAIWTPLPESTVFAGVKQIPPGGYLYLKGMKKTIAEYNPLQLQSEKKFQDDFSGAVSAVQSALKESTRIRLRSDVPVALYLSGGLDSSITTALALKLAGHQLKTFSIKFGEEDYNEGEKQKAVYEALGVENISLLISSKDITDTFPKSVWHAETVLFRTALCPLYLLSKEVQSQGIKVVLTGEGADELFLGYDIFKESILRRLYQGEDVALQDKLLDNLYPYLQHFSEANKRSLKAVFKKFSADDDSPIYSHALRVHNSLFALRFINHEHSSINKLLIYIQKHSDTFNSLNDIEKAQWLEMKTLLPGYLLSSQGDRMSLAHGVESRCPFLDPNVAALAASLPNKYKLKENINEKHILKCAFENYLPKLITKQPKQPYRAPDAASFIGKNQTYPDYVELLLSTNELKKIDFLNIKLCENFINQLRNKPSVAISQRENQSFIQLLSIALVQQQFIGHLNHSGNSYLKKKPKLVRSVHDE